MSVAPMRRYTKRAYLRLCPEKRRKYNLVLKGLNMAGISCKGRFTPFFRQFHFDRRVNRAGYEHAAINNKREMN